MNLKNTLKKAAVLGLSMSILIMTALPAHAASSDGDIELQEGELILGNLEVRDATAEELSNMKSGETVALNFDTREEFEAYIQQRKPQSIIITDKIEEKSSITPFGASKVKKKTIGVDPIPLPPVYINCQFDYTSKKNSAGKWYFTSVKNIDSWITGIGFPLSYTWSQKKGTYSYSNNKRNVEITCSGVIGTGIFIQGVGQFLEQNMTYKFDYKAIKG